MTKKRPFVNPENPETLLHLKRGHNAKAAAGLKGVKVAVQHVLNEMGPARAGKSLFALNQKGGIDCPSCAWPDPDDDRSVLGEYCENGAKAIAEEATSKKVTAAFFEKHAISALSELNDYEIGKKGRLAEPMYLAEGASHYTPISWEAAFEKIGSHLKSCNHPDEAVFYTSGRTSNEAAFLYQLFVRQFGTNNLPDCSNMCHESSGVALGESLGIGKGSVKLEDFYEAEVILILGQNPGTNHPRMLSALQKAKEKGALIISVNPLPETGLMAFKDPQSIKGALGIKSKLTDQFLQVRINGDLALLQAISYYLIQEQEKSEGVWDHAFIEEKTMGFDSWVTHIKSQDIDLLVKESGVSREQILETVRLIKHKNKIIACWAMGLTQHKNAVDTIKEVVNLLLAKGSIGKPGAGTCPVRGHSNVQGDRTMGIYEKPSEAFLDKLADTFGFEPPRKHGYDVVDCIHAMHAGKVKVFIAMGGNFLSATPDTLYTAEALQKTELTVQISTKLNRSHLITGKEALILPCLGRSDKDMLNGELQFVTTENSMGIIQMSKGVLQPVSEHLKSEAVIVCEMAKAVMGDQSVINWNRYLEHYDRIRWDIERCIPGFDLYNERARMPGGFYLPNSSREANFDKTATGKANFNVANIKPVFLQEGELIMQTLRSHDQFNTTIYGLDDRYRGIYNERRVLFIHAQDMEDLGFKASERVDLINNHGGRERRAANFILVPFDIPRGCTASYFPETNVLVPIHSVADKSNTPTSKWIVIRVQKHQTPVVR
jgi:molybdopterin-dependent oxidoreductase alpha subunit